MIQEADNNSEIYLCFGEPIAPNPPFSLKLDFSLFSQKVAMR